MIEPMEDLLEQKRGEREYYEASGAEDIVQAPFTRDGFEALLEGICTKRNGFKLPSPNDGLRVTLAAYLHSLEPQQEFSMGTAGRALHRAVSNRSTWCIDQEIKAKAKVALQQAQEKARAEAEAAKPVPRKLRRLRNRLAAIQVPSATP